MAAAFGKSFVSVPAFRTSQITLNHKVAVRTDGKQKVAVSSSARGGSQLSWSESPRYISKSSLNAKPDVLAISPRNRWPWEP